MRSTEQILLNILGSCMFIIEGNSRNAFIIPLIVTFIHVYQAMRKQHILLQGCLVHHIVYYYVAPVRWQLQFTYHSLDPWLFKDILKFVDTLF